MMYIINKAFEVVKIIPKKDMKECWQNDGINELDTISGVIKDTKANLDLLEGAFYFAVQHVTEKNVFHLYKKISVKSSNGGISFYGLQAIFDILKAKGYVKDYRPNNVNISTVLNRIFEGTGIELGFIDSRLPRITTTFYYMDKLEALNKIIDLTGCEIDFKISITGNKITMLYVDVYYQMGKNTGARFAYGNNALSIESEHDEAELATALVGRGKGEEVGDGYGRRITFEKIEWKKSNGDPVDKPLGQEYVEIPDATAIYGFSDGTPRMRIEIFEDIEDKEILLQKTYEKLLQVCRPKVQFKTTVAKVGNLNKGDTVTIISKHGYKYQTRVFKVRRNRLNNNLTEIKLGDYIVLSTAKKNAEFKQQINNQITDIVKEEVQTSMIAADGTKITWGAVEPTTKKVGDIWYEQLPNGKVEMKQWNGSYWEVLIPDALGEEIQEKITQMDADVEQARTAADNAVLQANQMVGKITVLETNLTNTTNLAGNAFVKAQETEGKAITLETNLNALDGRLTIASSNITGNAGRINALQLDYNGLSNTVANVQTDFNNLSVGARNLLPKSKADSLDGFARWNSNSELTIVNGAIRVKNLGTSNVIGVTTATFNVDSTKQYTLSLNAGSYYNTSTLDYCYLIFSDGQGNQRLLNASFNGSTTDLHRVSIKFKPNRTGEIRILIGRRIPDNATANFGFRINEVKVEEGTLQTAWSPAPEDLTTITEFSNLSQTVSAVQTTVATKANQSQVTQLANQITSVISGQKLNLLKNSDFREDRNSWAFSTVLAPLFVGLGTNWPTLSADAKKFIQVRAADFVAASQSFSQTIPNPEKYKGKILRASWHHFSPSGYIDRSVRVFFRYRLNGTYVQKTHDCLKTNGLWKQESLMLDLSDVKVSDTIDNLSLLVQFNPTFTAHYISITCLSVTEDGNLYNWGHEYCPGTDYSQITQLQDSINLRVAKDDIVSQINLSPESILIDGKRTHITGTTTINNGVIKTAHIAELAVGNSKIANLAVNAAKIMDLAITNAKIANATIIEAKIANAAITEAKIANAAITTAKIRDAAITNAKIANLDASKITTGTLRAITIDGVTINGGVFNTTSGNVYKMNISAGNIRFNRNDNNAQVGAIYGALDSNSRAILGISIGQELGYSFSIASKHTNGASYAPVIEIPSDSTGGNRKMNIYGELNLRGNTRISELGPLNTPNYSLRLTGGTWDGHQGVWLGDLNIVSGIFFSWTKPGTAIRTINGWKWMT